MKQVCLLLLILALILCGCHKVQNKGSAPEILDEVLGEVPLSEGYVYVRDGTQKTLTDAMLARLFPDARLDDLCYVKSMALYLSGRFCEDEILILELYDPSHGEALLALLKKRSEKKENAVLYADGVYLYLISGEKNKEILALFKG